MTRLGIPAKADEVLITNGSQQGSDLVAKIFLNPGRRRLHGEPQLHGGDPGVRLVPGRVRHRADGRRRHAQRGAGRHPGAATVKFIYALPNFQNPSGRR